MPELKEWGIYVYYAADVESKEMQDAARSSLESLASVGSSEDVGITAMIDLPGLDTPYYIMPQRPKGKYNWPVYPDRFLANVDSANIQTIADFLQWSDRNCPAKKVALIFWGHGYALDDFDPTLEQGGGGADKGRATARAASGFSADGHNELRLLFDSTHDSVLNNRDFGSVLRSFDVSVGAKRKIQVLGLDCCNMAMAEVVSELQEYADVLVAAESLLPFRSWLSEPALEKFLANCKLEPKDFAQAAIELFIESYDPAEDPYLELSACDLKKCGELERQVSDLTAALIAAIDEPENRAAIDRAWLRDVCFLADGFIDLGSFCKFLQQEMSGNARVSKAAGEVLTVLDQVVLYHGVAPASKDRNIALATGLTIWFPPWIRFPAVNYPQIDLSKRYLFNGYELTRFAQVTNWDQFLCKLFYLTQSR